MKKMTVRDITRIGIMAAAVYVASAFLQIPIPTAIGSTRLHMGNVMCLLSGMLLGAVPGGLAAGTGSMFFRSDESGIHNVCAFYLCVQVPYGVVMRENHCQMQGRPENPLYRRRCSGGFPLCPALYFQNLYRRPFRSGAAGRSCHAYRGAKECSIERKCAYCGHSCGSFRACTAPGCCKIYTSVS